MVSFEILTYLKELLEVIVGSRELSRVRVFLMPIFGLAAVLIFKIMIIFGFCQFTEVVLVVRKCH